MVTVRRGGFVSMAARTTLLVMLAQDYNVAYSLDYVHYAEVLF